MNILNEKSPYRISVGRRRPVGGAVLAAMICCAAPAGADSAAPVAETPVPASAAAPSAPAPANDATPQIAASNRAPAMQFISLGRVTFAIGKWELNDRDKSTLDAAAAYLAANPGAERVLLDGHADWTGGIKYNDELSDKRALAVQAYLTAKGLNPDLIHWKGHGKRAPIDENWTRLGRDRNRQVELYAVYLP
jgi:OOP family OmpA-OmpF porin